jgi:hypothetical protein
MGGGVAFDIFVDAELDGEALDLAIQIMGGNPERAGERTESEVAELAAELLALVAQRFGDRIGDQLPLTVPTVPRGMDVKDARSTFGEQSFAVGGERIVALAIYSIAA